MADEGIIDETRAAVSRHPYLIVGGVAALVLVLWLAAGSKAKAQNFTFSYGPSDSQIAAQTASGIQLDKDQTAVSLANIQAASNNDYFTYLASANTNGLVAQQTADAAGVQIAGIQSQTALGTAGYATQASIAASQAGVQTAATQAAAQVTTAGYAQSVQLTQAGVQLAQIGSTERLAANQQQSAASLAIMQQQVALTQIASTERLTANAQQANEAVALKWGNA